MVEPKITIARILVDLNLAVRYNNIIIQDRHTYNNYMRVGNFNLAVVII